MSGLVSETAGAAKGGGRYLSVIALVSAGSALGMDLGFEALRRTGEYAVTYGNIIQHEPWMIPVGIGIMFLLSRLLMFGAAWLEQRRVGTDVGGFLRFNPMWDTAFLPLILLVLQPAAHRLCLSSPATWIRLTAGIAVAVSLDTVFFREKHRHLTDLFSERAKNRMVIAVVFLCAVAWSAGLFGVRRHPVGDEPSYLMITHSLAQDLDINMNDDYAARAYRRFYSGKYPMFTHLGTDGINYPHHSLGLPILLAPVYRLALEIDDAAHIVFIMRFCLILIYTLLAWATLRLAIRLTKDVSASRWAVAVCFLSGPLFFFSAEIYPETLAGLILVLITFILVRCSGRTCPWSKAAAVAMAAYLPWLGIKYIAVASVAGLMILTSVIKDEKRFRNRVLPLVPAVISGAVYLAFLWTHYHNLNPVVIYTGVLPGTGTMAVPPGEPGFWETFPEKFFNLLNFWWGMLLEQRIGVLFLSPVYLLAVPGIWFGWRKCRRHILKIVVLVFIYVLLYGWQNNWGGFCPPNRQFIAIAPLVVVLTAFGWSGLKGRISTYYKLFSTVWAWGLAWILVHHERWLYHTMNPHLSGGSANWLRAFSPDYSIYLPSYFPLMMGDIRHPVANIVWTFLFISVLFVLLFVDRFSRYSADSTIHFRNCPGWLSLFFIVGLLYHWYFIPPGSYVKDLEGQPFEQMVILDDHHLGWEKDGFWVEGNSVSRMIVVFDHPEPVIELDLYSLTVNLAVVDFGDKWKRVKIPATLHRRITIKAHRYFQRNNRYYVKLQIFNANGCRPSDTLRTSDTRYLGVFVRFSRPKI